MYYVYYINIRVERGRENYIMYIMSCILYTRYSLLSNCPPPSIKNLENAADSYCINIQYC